MHHFVMILLLSLVVHFEKSHQMESGVTVTVASVNVKVSIWIYFFEVSWHIFLIFKKTPFHNYFAFQVLTTSVKKHLVVEWCIS